MYRILQSFKPSDVTAEETHKMGYELVIKFTKGKHQFVVSTHTDKVHIHTHIEFNSTNLECDSKFNNFKNSTFALLELKISCTRNMVYPLLRSRKNAVRDMRKLPLTHWTAQRFQR